MRKLQITTLPAVLLVLAAVGCSGELTSDGNANVRSGDTETASDASTTADGGGGPADSGDRTLSREVENGAVCGSSGECVSGYCDAETCAPCGASADCGASAACVGGVCQGTKAVGAACGSPDECESGFCPGDDGVCCDTACDGDCVACLGSKTGDADGSCGLVTAATDPDTECADQGAASCLANGMGCNGDAQAPGCELYPPGTECGAPSCVEGQQTAPSTCDGTGVCTPGTTSPCAPFVCGADACRADCSADTDCVGDASCVNGSCGLLPGGAACSGAAKCASGNCVDGVCCDSVCDMTCQACNVAGSEGVCSNVEAYTDPANECSGTQVCDPSGVCVPFCAGAGPATTPLDTEEQAFLVAINDYRATNNLGPLTNCTSLSRASQGHSEDMRDQNYFSHTGLNGSSPWKRSCDACFAKGCGPTTAMAENIAAGNSSGQATFTQWRNSPGHNANMLGSSFTRIGIGRATGGGQYGVYWTTVFAASGEASCD